LLGPLNGLDLDAIGWVIAGGESGPRHRPMAPEWVEEIRDLCTAGNVPFFFSGAGARRRPVAANSTTGRETSSRSSLAAGVRAARI
jgi:protein gp37